jgi:transcriptional regulator with XRE-family HTH domain
MNRTTESDEADVILGRRLKSLRVRRGLSQTALGKVLGVSFQQIQKFERGAHRMRVSQLWRVADGLGVPVTELLGVTRTNTKEITEMVDTPMARRLMDAFQGLTSGERRCLAALAEELAARRQRPRAAPATTKIGSDEQMFGADEQIPYGGQSD